MGEAANGGSYTVHRNQMRQYTFGSFSVKSRSLIRPFGRTLDDFVEPSGRLNKVFGNAALSSRQCLAQELRYKELAKILVGGRNL